MAADRPLATGVVLAAGGSSRLGRPKQLLPLDGATLLDAVLDVARASSFDQTIVTLGNAAEEIRAVVDLAGVEVVENRAFGAGCSSSIGAALDVVDARCEVLVLMLGDQPGVTPETVSRLLAGRGSARLAACRYDDGRGHPLAFGREAFDALRSLHGDKAVWKLLDRSAVTEVPIPGPVPRDVDTEDDYRALLDARSLPGE